MSFIKSIRRAAGAEIHLINGVDRGTPAWYYLRLDRTLTPILERHCAQEAENVDLTRYGTVLASGFGSEPPADIKARMEALANGEEDLTESQYETFYYFLMADDPEGRTFYAYIAVRGDRTDAFEQWAAHGEFDIKQWGIIIENGFGKPSAEIIARMLEEYGLQTPDFSEESENA